MTDVARDLRAHGYVSVSAATERLRKASDAGDAAPAPTRGLYHGVLLRLALDANEPASVRAQIGALEALAHRSACARCRFDALIGHAFLAMKETSVQAARPFLDQAQAASPVDDAQARMQWLALRGNIDGQDHKLNIGIETTLKALAMAEANGDAAEAVRMLGTLVWMNTDLADYKRATELGEQAYARAAAMHFRPMMARISLDLGHAYALAGDRNHQREAIERALVLSRDDPALLNIQALSLNNLSDFYLSQDGQYALALDYARQAEALARSHRREIHRAAPLTNIGIALAKLGRVDEGIGYIRQAIAIARKLQVQEYVLGITQELVKVLEGAGRYREALVELHTAQALESGLTAQQRDKAVLELQEKYEARTPDPPDRAAVGAECAQAGAAAGQCLAPAASECARRHERRRPPDHRGRKRLPGPRLHRRARRARTGTIRDVGGQRHRLRHVA